MNILRVKLAELFCQNLFSTEYVTPLKPKCFVETLISTKVFKGKLLRSRLDSSVISGEKEIENLTFSDPFQKLTFGYNSLSQKHYKVWVLFQQGMTINLKPQKPS